MTKKKDKVDPASPFAKLKEVKEKLARDDASAKKSAKQPAPRPSSARASAPARASGASETDEERLAFHRLMSGVTPLEQKGGRVPRSQAPRSSELARASPEDARRAAEREADEVRAHLLALVEGKESFETRDDGRRVEGRRVDVGEEVLRKLRRGYFPIDARLDLHGLGVREAREALDAFLHGTRARGERCVLVIHGKGEHSPRGAGVLRGEVATWISQGAACEHVAAFTTAMNDDGGEGAMYVLLKR